MDAKETDALNCTESTNFDYNTFFLEPLLNRRGFFILYKFKIALLQKIKLTKLLSDNRICVGLYLFYYHLYLGGKLNSRIKHTVSLFCFSFLFFVTSCASVKQASQNGNERRIIIGKAVHADSTIEVNAMVSLFDVCIVKDRDSIQKSYSTNTGKNGCFVLEDIPDGVYLLYVYDVSMGKCNLSCITKQQNSFQLTQPLVLKSLITIKGRVINAGADLPVKVIVPGIGASSLIDNKGYYTISDVPAGSYELAFISKNSVEYVKVNVDGGISDTVFLKTDLRFRNLDLSLNNRL